MSRTVKLTAAAAFGGLFAALAIVTANRPAPPPIATTPSAAPEARSADQAQTLRRCRNASTVEPDCAAAWEAERRRFFRTQDRTP